MPVMASMSRLRNEERKTLSFSLLPAVLSIKFILLRLLARCFACVSFAMHLALGCTWCFRSSWMKTGIEENDCNNQCGWTWCLRSSEVEQSRVPAAGLSCSDLSQVLFSVPFLSVAKYVTAY